MRFWDPGRGNMEYQNSYSHHTRPSRKSIVNGARALIVFFVAMALLTSLPMSAPDVKGARLINTFKDGETSMLIEFTTDPLPGEVATVYLKVKADATVAQATMKASAVMLELSNAFSLQAAPTFTLANRGIDTSGDLNGDGLTELVLTAPGRNTNQGYIGGFAGRNTGYVTNPQEIIIQGTTNNDFLGWALSTGGDIDGDGYDDLVSSRIKMDFGTSTGTGVGDVLIWWGGRTISANPDVTISYGSSGDMFGYDVWADGDINGDGNMDLVVGAPRHVENTNNPGRAYVYHLDGNRTISNAPNITLTGTDNGDAFGYLVRICGDVNGDGYDDVLVTAPSHNGTGTDFDVGKAYVYHGSSSGIKTTADWTYTGTEQSDLLGYSATGVGDVNDDGYDDILLGVPNYDTSTITDAGAGLVFYGGSGGLSSSPDVTIEGDTGTGWLGYDVAYCQDINGDGIDDFVLSAPNTSNGTLTSNGHIQVHFGDSGGVNSAPDKKLGGWYTNGDMGSSVGPCGDGNGDGYSDVCAGDMTILHTYVFYGGADAAAPKINLDDVEIWSKSDALRGDAEIPDFSIKLNAYIQAHQGEEDEYGNLIVPINVSLGRAGKIKLHSIIIQIYKLVVPTGFDARPMAEGNAVRLSWDDHTAKTDDISKMAIEFWNGTDWEELEKVSKRNTTHVIRGLEDGTEYRFRLRAFDGDVQAYSIPSVEVAVTPGDTKAPDKVINLLTVEDRDLMGINVSWAASDEDTANYEVWSNKSGEWAVLTNVSAPMTYYIDTDVEDGPRYFYRIRAWDEVPLESPLSTIVWGVLNDLEPPSIPTGLRIEVVSSGRALTISWNLNTDDTVAYSIESNRTGDWREVILMGMNDDTYTDTGLEDDVRYYYRMRARDEADNPSNFTAIVSAITVDSEPPVAPTGLTVEPRPVGNMLRLTWDLNTDDTASYLIYIWDETSSVWELKGQVSQGTSMYEITGLENGVSYQFRVKAVDGADSESEWSNEVTARPADTHPPDIPQGIRTELDPNGRAVNISWDTNNDDTVAYVIMQWSGTRWVEVGMVDHPQDWLYIDGLENNQPYAYVVRSLDEADNESPNSLRVDVIPTDTIRPEPPVFLDLPPSTNEKDQVLRGYCEPNVKITVYLNLYPQDPVYCDDDGYFEVTLRLKSGPNEVTAEAEDDAGKSDMSIRHTIYVDLAGPSVESTVPETATKNVERINFTFEVTFTEEVKLDSIKAYLVKGKFDTSTLVANIGSSNNIIPVLKEYNRVRSVVTFEVTEELDGTSDYSILVYGVEDLAGNSLDYPQGAFSIQVQTESGGTSDNGGTTDDGGFGSLAIYVAAAIVIILVVVIAIFLVSRSGARDEVVTDREIRAAPLAESSPETQRPDIATLYEEAYEERGEAEPEHHDVEAGLGDWLAEQDKASQEAEVEARRLMEEMHSDAPPPEDTGPIEKVPPGVVEERAVPAYHMDTPETEGTDDEAAEEETEEEVEEEADEEADAAALLDELEEDLESSSEDEEKEKED